MTDAPRTVPVESGDILSRIAKRNGFTVKELLSANPQIRNPDKLSVGQRINLPPGKKFELTVRFVNSWDLPPVGIRYALLDGKKTLAQGRILLLNNEVTFDANDGAAITFMAQQIGDTELRQVGTIAAKRECPVVVARINSVKLPSLTEPHPKSPAAPPPNQEPAKKPPAPAGGGAPAKKDQGLPNRPAKDDEGKAKHEILPGECACGRDLTIDELVAIFPSRKKEALEPYLDAVNAMLKTYSIDSCLRKAHALAQIGHESGSLRYREEILKKGVKEADVYDGYKGRGLIQITYKAKYVEYGNYKGVDFTDDNKTKLESIEYATDSAGWFWNNGSAYALNDYADKNDLILISAAINGGFNGFDDRAAIFKRAHKKLNAPKCKVEANRSADYLAFDKSKAYDTRDMAFAWGLWSDAKSSKEGLTKDAAASKAGYARFLELNKTSPIKRKRFGFKTTKAMIDQAEERSK